jgi:hypothetical protein
MDASSPPVERAGKRKAEEEEPRRIVATTKGREGPMFLSTDVGLKIMEESLTAAQVNSRSRRVTVAGGEVPDAGYPKRAKTAGLSVDDSGVFISFHRRARVVCVGAVVHYHC